jgi:signal peptidase I
VSARPDAEAAAGPASSRGSRRPRLLALVAVAIVLAALVQAFVAQTYVVPSAVLAPTVQPGERLVVWKVRSAPEPGDVVVVDTTRATATDRSTPVDDGPVGSVLSTMAGWLRVDLGSESRLGVVSAVDGEQIVLRAPEERTTASGDIVGEAVWRLWPLDRLGPVDAAQGGR